MGKEVLPGAGTPLSCPCGLGAAPVYTAVPSLAGCVDWEQGFTFSVPSSVCRTAITMRGLPFWGRVQMEALRKTGGTG